MSDSAPDPALDNQGGEVALKFADLGLDPKVLKAIQEVGYETPSPIQAATIPALLEGRDARSRSG